MDNIENKCITNIVRSMLNELEEDLFEISEMARFMVGRYECIFIIFPFLFDPYRDIYR